jgi:hypothetical protein
VSQTLFKPLETKPSFYSRNAGLPASAWPASEMQTTLFVEIVHREERRLSGLESYVKNIQQMPMSKSDLLVFSLSKKMRDCKKLMIVMQGFYAKINF